MARTLSSLALLLGLTGGLCFLVTPARDPRPQISRQEFANRLFKIQEGMSQKDVLAILGKPDDILTENDPVHFERDLITEAWCYGSRWHQDFPMLGKVEFDLDKKVFFCHFPEEKSPRKVIPPALIPERDLRTLFELLNQIDSAEDYFFDPLSVIRAVNALQPLGKEKALAVLEEHYAVTRNLGDQLVLRALFDVPPDPVLQGPTNIGQFSGKEILSRFPRYPIHFFDDVPLFIRAYDDFSLQDGSVPEPIKGLRSFQYFREKGTLRQRPLNPCRNPLELFQKWETQTKGLYSPSGFPVARVHIARQILLLIQTINGTDYPIDYFTTFNGGDYSRDLEEIIKSGIKTPFFWDNQKNIYTYYDGSFFSKKQQQKFRNIVLYFDDVSGKFKLTMKRHDVNNVQFSNHWVFGTSQGGLKIRSLEVSVIREKDKKTLFHKNFEDTIKNKLKNSVYYCSMHSSDHSDLPQGESVTVTIQLNGQTKTIPGLKP